MAGSISLVPGSLSNLEGTITNVSDTITNPLGGTITTGSTDAGELFFYMSGHVMFFMSGDPFYLVE